MENSKAGVSVIIPAWRAEKFLDECLQSILSQTYFNDFDEWEILVGIDGCEKTREAIKEYRQTRFYWFPKNRGPYIVRNTLSKVAKYPWILFFDADDIAKPDLIEKAMAQSAPYICFGKCNFYPDGREKPSRPTDGIILIWKKTFFGIGGFQPWLCGADTEFRQRMARIGIIRKIIPEILVMRRMHKDNLTVRKETNKRSALRQAYWKIKRQNRIKGITKINMVTGECHIIAA